MTDTDLGDKRTAFRFCTYNCNGLGDFKKRKDVFDFLREKQCSIYFLQETHLLHNSENFIRSCWGYTTFLAGCDTNKNGVAILFNNNFEYKVHNVIRDPHGCYILLDIELLEKRMTLVNVYGPSSGDHPEFFDTVCTHIDHIGNDIIVAAGDWNVVLNMKLDSRNYQSTVNRPRTRKKIFDVMVQYELIDVFRNMYPTKRKYSWRKFNSIKQGRLDFFLVSENLISEVVGTEVGPSYRSDHSIVQLFLKKEVLKRDKQYWKFNNSLLKDKSFVTEIKTVIYNLKKEYALPVYNFDNIDNISDNDLQFTISDQLFFEMLLLKIREKTISYSCYKKKADLQKERELESEIKLLSDNLDEHVLDRLECLNVQLQELRDNKVQGMIVRSRINWIQNGEKPSRYFCNLENRNFVDRTMSFLSTNDGNIIYKQDDVLKEVQDYYECLYSARDVTDVNLDTIVHEATKLSQCESDSLEGPLSYTEACCALKNMSNNKSPGSDGFTVEFFKFFFINIGVFLVRSVNEGFLNKNLSVTQRQGIIICIPKDDKPKQYLKNWRPISLLNTAYKIVSASIANRLKNVLPKIIHDDQKGFMKGRYIGENIRKIYDVLRYTEAENIPGLLLSVDIEKAFDSVSWAFMQKALEFFNFGPCLIQWIATLYHSPISCVSVNGQYSKWFSVCRGVRQGDPSSSYLYLLCAEIMSILIRQNVKIKGIQMNELEVLLSQFADDTNVCLDGSEESFNECMRVLRQFSDMSGLKINFEKTNVVWIGRMKNSNIRYLRDENFCWNPGTFRILGILFCIDTDRMIELNYDGKLMTIRRDLHKWNKRQLTPLGKITILKTIIFSKLTYLFLNLPDPPANVMKEIENMMFKFLWNEKPAKIKRSVVCKPYIDGGLQMIDVAACISSLKISWLKRITDESEFQKFIFNIFPDFQCLHKLGEEYIHVCMQRCRNPFWVDVLKHFKKLYVKCCPENLSELMSECIHYNVNILRDRKVICVKEWINNDILYIRQLFNSNNNKFLTFVEFKEKYPVILKTNFLLYSGVIDAIQQYLIKTVITFDDSYRVVETKAWSVACKGSKLIKLFFLKNDIVPTAVLRWNEMFEDINWKDVFCKCFKFSDTKLKWFQARVLHRLLPTRKFLFDRKIVDDPFCNLCSHEVQTLQHLLWSCVKTQNFWSTLLLLIKNCPHCHALNLSEELVLFGNKNNVMTDSVIEYILVSAKYYIYTSYRNNKTPRVKTFLAVLKNRYVELEMLSYVNGTSIVFANSWSLYQSLFV